MRLIILVAMALLVTTAWDAVAAPPNIIVVMTDDQRWDALGCAGHPFLKTPNIDRLAREGAIFQNAFVTTPLCSPSRATFLTGQYVHKHGVRGNGDSKAISHSFVTWPALLQKAGYTTGYVGKIHMGNDPTPRPGFDYWVGVPGQGRYVNPRLHIDGELKEVPGYMTDVLTDDSVEFLKKQRDATKPFALVLAHKAIHGPFTPAERHKDLYADEKIHRAPSVDDDLSGKPAIAGKTKGGPGENVQRNMLRAIVAVDEGVGKIIAALEESKQLADTLIVFTSDNGDFWGEHRLGDKRAAYEESIRVPLVMRYPKKIAAGSKPTAIALNADLAPTCLALAGVAIPSDMHGKSLLPVLGGKSDGWRSAALFEYFMEKQFAHIPNWQAVRTDRWKYIHYTDVADADELYDLQNDPHEMKNLIADESSKATLDQVKGQLERLLDETK